MEPSTTVRSRVPIHHLTSRITPTDDIFVLAHFGVPRIQEREWRLHVLGLISRPCTMTLDEIRSFPRYDIEAFIKCAGFPADHRIATRNASNAVWSGARLADVMESVGLSPQASYLWFSAPDYGSYQDWSAGCYTKDLAVSRMLEGDVLLAYEVNGEPLPAEHGYPLRVFVPGFYGTNSVKWLCRIEASERRAPGIFTNQLYNDPVMDGAGRPTSATRPVWGVEPEALIVSPEDGSELPAGPIHVSGWCWGEHPVDRVEVTVDGGTTWTPAVVHDRRQRSWQAFSVDVFAETPGCLSMAARATDTLGLVQPWAEARNAIHEVHVTIVSAHV